MKKKKEDGTQGASQGKISRGQASENALLHRVSFLYINNDRYLPPNEPLPIFFPRRYFRPTRSSRAIEKRDKNGTQ
jgi:hypothetical protein